MKTLLFLLFWMLVLVSTSLTLFLVSILWFLNYDQDAPQFNLPEGAIARLGKGWRSDVQYSPDGTLLAVPSSIGIWIYDAETTQEPMLLIGNTGAVTSVSFSPDGKTLAGGCQDNNIRLWNVFTGTHKATLIGHTRHVTSVSFSPDGQTLASGSEDGSIHLWNVDTGTRNATFMGHIGEVTSVNFRADAGYWQSGQHSTSLGYDTLSE